MSTASSYQTPIPWWQRLLPGVAVARSYEKLWLRSDIVAGLTVAAYLIPQVMAYAQVAGLAPVTGLWAIIGSLVVYSLLGTSRLLSCGPESTTALMTAAGVGALLGAAGAADSQRYAQVAALLAIAVGLLCILAWVGRLGFLSTLLSRPVLVGYMAGIAMLMILSQLGKITRLSLPDGGIFTELGYLATHLTGIHWPTFMMAAVVVVALFAFKRWLPAWPGPLLVLALAAVVVAVFNLEQHGFRVLGTITQGMPAPAWPGLGDLAMWELFPAAIGIVIVGYSDMILTARAFASRHHTKIDSNQELLALGGANIAAGFLHGFPISSSGSRTALAEASGGRTQLHSLVAAISIVATLFFLAPLLATFPSTALGALVIYAAIRLIDVNEIKRVIRFRHSEAVLMVVTFLGVLFLGVLQGIGIAVVLSLLELLARLAKPHDAVLGCSPNLIGMHDIADYPQATQIPGLVVYRYESPLFFANAENLTQRALTAMESAPTPTRWFVLDMEANSEVDLTAVDALEDLRRSVTEQGIVFAIARMRFELSQELSRTDFLSRIDPEHIFPRVGTAVAAYQQWHEDHYGKTVILNGNDL